MCIDASIQVHCKGQHIVAVENDTPGVRNGGMTIVTIGNRNVRLVLGNVSADQLDSLASDLRTIAQDMRVGRHDEPATDGVVDAEPAPGTIVRMRSTPYTDARIVEMPNGNLGVRYANGDIGDYSPKAWVAR